MNKYGVYHITEAPYCYAKNYNTLSLRIRVSKDDVIKCSVFYKDKYLDDLPYESKQMNLITQTELFDYFECDIKTGRNRYQYYFELIDKDNDKYFLTERGIDDSCNYPYIFPYIAHEDVYEEVKWIQKSVVYQIFPERFCNGDKTIDSEYVMPWGDEKNFSYHTRYGGDFQGIIDKLDYLEELGVDIIYLTPVFKSNTPHKYNTSDYFDIDPEFGDVDKAKELIEKCHQRNIKIILDAVFNHSGNDFFAFEDLLENQENSKYKDWYFADSYPIDFQKGNYYTFGNNHRNMPKLNTNNAEVREYLLNVGEYWIKEIGIDGWRLDVCDEIGHDFWRAFKKRIKSVNKDAVIIGEIMHEAGTFLKGDQLDGIMNYPFKNAVTDFFAKKTIKAEKLSNILGNNRMLYMNSITKQMWNLIDSHDTARFLTDAGEDVRALMLATVFQFTYIGVPYIYYGDEIGINGGDDPYNRRCMRWNREEQNLELLDFYKKLIQIRKSNEVLVDGEYKEIYFKDNVLVFERKLNEQSIIVVINNNNENKTINLLNSFEGTELIKNERIFVDLSLEISAMDGKIITIKSNSY